MARTINLKNCNVEDNNWWNLEGKKIGNRNLIISIPCLLSAFSVWMFWSIICVQMLNAGFPFEKSQLFTLMSIAGLSGATLRIPSTFFIRPCGGRNVIFFTTLLLIIPSLGAGIALQDKETPFWTFQLLALLSGIGGGNFASSMSNISSFFPKKDQGYALGLNAGLGNFGVTTMQLLIPFSMMYGFFCGPSLVLVKPSGSLLGKIPAGGITYIQNAGLVWVPFLIILVILAFIFMNNIISEKVTPKEPRTFPAIFKMSWLLLIGLLTSGTGAYLFIIVHVSKWIVLPLIIISTVFAMKYLSPKELRSSLEKQFKIFSLKHNWIMTIIYTMTFGSFIGFSAAFPLAIEVIFGFKHVAAAGGGFTHTMVNPNAPSSLSYAWIAPFLGAIIRPIGGKIADKIGGSIVTLICSIVMIICTLSATFYMLQAYQSETPEIFFIPFFIIFLILFLATGVGNGSVFRSIAVIFSEEHRGPALGWSSAVAAYGSFFIPMIIGEQIKAATPEYAMYGFAAFYFVCAILTWWYYLGPKAEFKNP
ncbi:MAG: MFS transporter [Pseudomonadota bacterium]